MNNYLSLTVAFALCCVLNFALLPLLRKLKAGQQILCYVTEHADKQGTPTMGGISFIVAIVITSCMFCDINNKATVVALCVFVGYGIVGFLDDFIKIRYKHNMGLHAYQKVIFQLIIAVVVSVFVYNDIASGDVLNVPFTQLQIDIGGWIIPLVIFIFLACTNGVNLTDGIDGLATSTTVCFLVMTILLLQNELVKSDNAGDTYSYRQIKSIITLCFVSIGALSAFLLFNCNNAKVFMGDTGSLALGALVACSTIFTRMSLFIPIVGIMYVVSCISVIIQVVYFKLTKGKRIFLMAPYHHHLQKKGYSETRICIIYCVITVLSGCLLLYFGGYYG